MPLRQHADTGRRTGRFKGLVEECPRIQVRTPREEEDLGNFFFLVVPAEDEEEGGQEEGCATTASAPSQLRCTG